MANSKIYYNMADISSSSVSVALATGYTVKNLTDNIPQNKCRNTVITVTDFEFDMGAVTAIKGIGVFGSSVESGDTQFELFADNFSPPTTSRGNFNKANDSVLEVVANYRYFKIRIVKASGTYIEIGMVYFFVDSYEFIVNYHWDYTAGTLRSGTMSQSPSAAIYNNIDSESEDFQLQFTGLSDAQRNIFNDDIGSNNYIIFKDQYDGSNSYLYFGVGKFSKPKRSINTWSMNLNIKQAK